MLNEASKSVEEDHHTVAIAGTVIDAFTNLHIFDAVVEILGSNLHIQAGVDGSFYLISDHLTESIKLPTSLSKFQDGFFYFMDLPPGDYTLKVSAPNLGSRYGTTTIQNVTVQNAVGGKPIFDAKNSLEVTLSPTQLRGQVKDKDNVQTIPNALVQLGGSETQTFTDKEGNYVLSGIVASKPTVQVSEQVLEQGVVKYIKKYTQKVELIAGKTTTANFPKSAS